VNNNFYAKAFRSNDDNFYSLHRGKSGTWPWVTQKKIYEHPKHLSILIRIFLFAGNIDILIFLLISQVRILMCSSLFLFSD
jgi:hypothetical protein